MSLPNVPVLDASFYRLSGEELQFFKSQTGIQDEEELKKHIMNIQQEAWEVHPYPCIRGFAFTRLKISRLPAYQQLLILGKEREGAIFLDIGCCFGNDLRKAIVDGFPAENTIASDLYADFLQLGHKLFKSSPETFAAHFIPGNAFDQAFLKTVPPFYSPPKTARPDLGSLNTLSPLAGHVSVIHASELFHLFDEPQQLELAHALAGLLSPEPGSFIFGEHGGKPVKGYRTEGRPRSDGTYQFCHSPETWTALWDGEVFAKGTVRVEARLLEIQGLDLNMVADPNTDAKFWIMLWSVTRV
ncbi:predicted protein [Postia placenta Mad-698-R]|uniref:Methyltransferase domain-containing protein n=1 Tax=Postia placenta MAD-698-R-SB12 TaxID=670580 RepID=A0A1X6NGI2_9APHY|nr:hypothetical protein POSPLADRAFT_1042931 [Postia placenta MAD-698-R-SB12]EED81259.1 predicted protein [Postia placenta Mad-698-R]OSX67737.1 hypothetical protein POSPLADRAFT_1042931 [Postia placenta MAD-698-R-SB12]